MEKEQTPYLASCCNQLYLGITLTTPRGIRIQLVWSGAQEIGWFKTSSGDNTQLRLELLK